MFRYRPLEKILDKKELQNHSIYLPSEQSDQYEAWVNFYWAGDRIIWRNLLIHFYLTLSDVIDLGVGSPKNNDQINSVLRNNISANFKWFKDT